MIFAIFDIQGAYQYDYHDNNAIFCIFKKYSLPN